MFLNSLCDYIWPLKCANSRSVSVPRVPLVCLAFGNVECCTIQRDGDVNEKMVSMD